MTDEQLHDLKLSIEQLYNLARDLLMYADMLLEQVHKS